MLTTINIKRRQILTCSITSSINEQTTIRKFYTTIRRFIEQIALATLL